MRLGIFGGTFDPPHFSHLILAEEAREQLALDSVLWLPAGQSPFKQLQSISPVEQRLQMVAAAIGGNSHFELSRVDCDRPPPQYSADTIAILQQAYPQATLYWIMGADSLRDLPQWERSAEFIAGCQLAVLKRPGVTMDLSDIERALAGVRERVHWVQAPAMEIAARDIRQRVREGRSIRYLTPRAVCRIIERAGLYRAKKQNKD